MSTLSINRAVKAAGSQSALARAIGVSQGLVWQWCNGARIHAHHFEGIQAVTGVGVMDLLDDELAKARQANCRRPKPATKESA